MARRIDRLVAGVGALALLLAACGDDDTATDGAGSEDQVEEEAEGALEGQLGGECAFLGEFAGAGLEEAFDPGTMMTDSGEAFSLLADEVQEVADAAPDEISDAFQTLADGFEQMADVFAEVDLSDPENIDPSAFEAFEEGPGADFESAAEEVDAWIQENCEVDAAS